MHGITLRMHRPGDIGWVVSAHGELYAREFGFDETFEALVAEIAAQFLRKFNPERERCWIAELGGEKPGLTPDGGTSPETFEAFIRAEIAKWGEVVRKSGATVDQ